MTTGAWIEADWVTQKEGWSAFEAAFGFRPSVNSAEWPAIREPIPSVTIDLSPIFDNEGPTFASGASCVDAVALHAFVQLLGSDDRLLVLDWQHPCYLFSPHRQALDSEPWEVTVFPNGDYYIFLAKDMTAGVFGHPWEQTLCIWGSDLIPLLADPLAIILPVARRDGQ